MKRYLATLGATVVVLVGAPFLGQAFDPYSTAQAATATGDPVIGVVGDMACDPQNPNFGGGDGNGTSCGEKATAAQMASDSSLDALLGLGDYQYDCDDPNDFDQSYTPTWGVMNDLIDPVAGNHEYLTGTDAWGDQCPSGNATADTFFSYFGANALPNLTQSTFDRGYFSFDLGNWHIIGLNGNCNRQGVGGCGASSQQTTWLQSDLANDHQPCTLAYWHQPLFTGLSGSVNTAYQAWWNALYAAHADVVLNGHVHNYQRFAALDPNGAADATNGITEYIVGTGGEAQVGINVNAVPQPVAKAKTFGYMKMSLGSSGWSTQFVDSTGAVGDTSAGVCHGAASVPTDTATPTPTDTTSPTPTDSTSPTPTDTTSASPSDTTTVTPTPTPTTTSLAPQELLTNNSVEILAKVGKPYLGKYSSNDSVTWSTDTAHDGTHSIRIHNATLATDNSGLKNRPTTITSTTLGATYTASVWVKAPAATPVTPQPVWLKLTETGKKACIGKVALTDTNWHQITWQYVAKQSGDALAYAVIAKQLPLGQSVYADQFSVTTP